MLGKYIGQMVELVYMDREGQITQRQIRINSVRGGMIRASAGKKAHPEPFWSKVFWHGVLLRT